MLRLLQKNLSRFGKPALAFLLALSLLSAFLPAAQTAAAGCCRTQTQISCCASKPEQSIMCCAEEAGTPTAEATLVPVVSGKSLSASGDLAAQQPFFYNACGDGDGLNLEQDFYSSNHRLSTNQRYKLFATLLI